MLTTMANQLDLKWIRSRIRQRDSSHRQISVALVALEERNSATSLCVLDLGAAACVSSLAPLQGGFSESPDARVVPSKLPSVYAHFTPILNDSCAVRFSTGDSEARFLVDESTEFPVLFRDFLPPSGEAQSGFGFAWSLPSNPESLPVSPVMQTPDHPASAHIRDGVLPTGEGVVVDSMTNAVNSMISANNAIKPEVDTVSVRQTGANAVASATPAQPLSTNVSGGLVRAIDNIPQLKSSFKAPEVVIEPAVVLPENQVEQPELGFSGKNICLWAIEPGQPEPALPIPNHVQIAGLPAFADATTDFAHSNASSLPSSPAMAVSQRLADPSVTVSVAAVNPVPEVPGRTLAHSQQDRLSVNPVGDGGSTIAQVTGASQAVFRVIRHAESGPEITVSYSVTGYGGTKSSPTYFQATLPAGARETQITIPAGAAGHDSEIVMVSLGKTPNYEIVAATAISPAIGKLETCSDAGLLSAFREGGSEEAFTLLRNRHWNDVVSTCRKVLGNWSDAEDASQLVFFALSQAKITFPIVLTRWLHRVASNAALDLARSRKRRKKHERIAARPVSVPGDEPLNQLDDRLEEALALLPAPLQQAVRLKYISGWSQKEAARLAGCPRGTLSRRAMQGIRMLRDVLTRDARVTS